ncbi:MAG: hypothetical protein RI964_801 [Pseudomonadota bacterium]|jgi:hypothetical protein
MTIVFVDNVNLTRQQLLQLRFENLAVDPSAGVSSHGCVHFNTTEYSLKVWNGLEYYSTDARQRTDIPISNLATNPLARANHTGTQTAATISNFDAQVRASRLDQMSAPAASLNANNQRIINVAQPTAGSDAVRLSDLEAVRNNTDSKPSVKVVSTANITLSGTQTIDGVALVAGDEVLVTAQTTASANGTYVVAAGAWSRRSSEDATGEITPGSFWIVEQGTAANAGSTWRLTNTGTITLGTTALTFVKAQLGTTYSGGNGVAVSGSSIAVDLAASNSGLRFAGGKLELDTANNKIQQATYFDIGVSGAGTITSFNSSLPVQALPIGVYVYEIASGNQVNCGFSHNPTTGQMAFSFGAGIAAGTLAARVIYQGVV